MKFGLSYPRSVTGAEAAVLIQQVAALLLAPFMLFSSGYRGLFASHGFLSILFDAGISTLPRAETLALSFVYRKTESDLLFFFAALILALAWGLLSRRLLRGEKTALKTRFVLAALILADLILRLLPFHFNRVFGLPMGIFGFAVWLISLVLVLLDIRAYRNESAGQTSE